MPYRLLADFVVVIHLAFILFAVLGGLFAIRWQRVMWMHIPAVLWSALIEFAGWICPLTPLENWLRFKGGAVKSLQLPKPQKSWEAWTTDSQVVSEIDRLFDQHTAGEIADILNKSGYVSGQGKPFDARRIGKIQRAYGLKSRLQRLQAAGFLTAEQLAAKLGMTSSAVRARRAKGRLNLKTVRLNDTGQYLYEDPTSLVSAS